MSERKKPPRVDSRSGWTHQGLAGTPLDLRSKANPQSPGRQAESRYHPSRHGGGRWAVRSGEPSSSRDSLSASGTDAESSAGIAQSRAPAMLSPEDIAVARGSSLNSLTAALRIRSSSRQTPKCAPSYPNQSREQGRPGSGYPYVPDNSTFFLTCSVRAFPGMGGGDGE